MPVSRFVFSFWMKRMFPLDLPLVLTPRYGMEECSIHILLLYFLHCSMLDRLSGWHLVLIDQYYIITGHQCEELKLQSYHFHTILSCSIDINWTLVYQYANLEFWPKSWCLPPPPHYQTLSIYTQPKAFVNSVLFLCKFCWIFFEFFF